MKYFEGRLGVLTLFMVFLFLLLVTNLLFIHLSLSLYIKYRFFVYPISLILCLVLFLLLDKGNEFGVLVDGKIKAQLKDGSFVISLLYLRDARIRTIKTILFPFVAGILMSIIFIFFKLYHYAYVGLLWVIFLDVFVFIKYLITKYRVNSGLFGSNYDESNELMRFISEHSSRNKDDINKYNRDAFLPEKIIECLIGEIKVKNSSI
jgi:hypothetical protein